MKKALKLLLVYLITFFVSLLIGTCAYMIYNEVQGFIAGQKMNFFDKDQILKAVFFVSYGVCFFVCPFTAYYRVRHNSGLPQTIMFVILVIVTWGGIFPGLNMLENFCYQHLPETNKISHLSGGYFRQNENRVYYFTRDFYSNFANNDHTNAVIIDTTEDGVVDFTQVKDEPDFELYTAAQPFNEIQTKNAFKPGSMKIPFDVRLLIDRGLESFVTGWSFYLGFISIGILLGSLYVFASITDWKLYNVCILMSGTILVLFVNCLLSAPISSKFTVWAEGLGFIEKLKTVFYNPVLVIINLISAVIVIAVGVVTTIIKKHRAKAGE